MDSVAKKNGLPLAPGGFRVRSRDTWDVISNPQVFFLGGPGSETLGTFEVWSSLRF